MTDHINDGWAWISNGTDYLKVYVEEILWWNCYRPEMNHVPGANIAFDVSLFFMKIKLVSVWVDTNTKINNFLSYIKSWQQANTLQIEVVRDSSNNKEKLDGTNTVFPVLVNGDMGAITKIAHGDGTIYNIEEIMLEQRAAAS